MFSKPINFEDLSATTEYSQFGITTHWWEGKEVVDAGDPEAIHIMPLSNQEAQHLARDVETFMDFNFSDSDFQSFVSALEQKDSSYLYEEFYNWRPELPGHC